MAFSRKRSGSEKRKRSSPIPFRVTDEERAQIEAFAERAGLTVSSYVRSRALAKPTTRAVRRAPVATAQLAQLLGMLGPVLGSLQTIKGTLSPGEENSPAELPAAIAEIRACANAVMETLGKRPLERAQ